MRVKESIFLQYSKISAWSECTNACMHQSRIPGSIVEKLVEKGNRYRYGGGFRGVQAETSGFIIIVTHYSGDENFESWLYSK